MNRADILETAKEIVTSDRNNQYGEPEDNFDTIASLWNAYLGGKHSVQGWQNPYVNHRERGFLHRRGGVYRVRI